MDGSPDIRRPSDNTEIESKPSNASSRECETCHLFRPGITSKTDPATFIRSAESCPCCAVVLQALDAVTDIRRPEFTELELERGGEWLPDGLIEIRCLQKGDYNPDELGKNVKDPFPNRYKIYTPADAGEDRALPWLGLRKSENDTYREHSRDLSDRLALAKSWLDECVTSHRTCAVVGRELPRRLLDVSTSPIRLIEYPTETAFAALSYCWGTSGNLTTVKSNLQSHIDGIALDKFPQTLADAVRICRALGLRYLWIDALCILQDDTEDWLSQIPLMSSIYSGAMVTISLQSSATVHDGCLNFGQSGNSPFARLELNTEWDGVPREVKLSIQEENVTYYSGVPGHHSSRPTDDNDVLLPLSTRAWAFQERFLSSRILFCTPSELSWQCSEHTRCECEAKPRPAVTNVYGDYLDTGQLAPILHLERDSPSQHLKRLSLWCEIMRQYSIRQLTVWTDRLPAIQGVVEAVTQGFPEDFKKQDYVFGLWRPFLQRSLSWHRNTLVEVFPTAASGLESYVPSWSWVGCPGPVEYYSQERDSDSTPLIDVLDLDMTRSSPMGSFGPGKGRLVISGSLIPVRMDIQSYMPGIFFRFPNIFQGPEDSFFNAPNLEMEFDNPLDGNSCTAVTHFLPLIRASGLPTTSGIFLVPVEGSGGHVFRRVGFAYDYGGNLPWLEVDLKPYLQTVTLI
ncbi:Fc.00g033420.m01.CDS01 [Cosmosporella sp. VM-42]